MDRKEGIEQDEALNHPACRYCDNHRTDEPLSFPAKFSCIQAVRSLIGRLIQQQLALNAASDWEPLLRDRNNVPVHSERRKQSDPDEAGLAS